MEKDSSKSEDLNDEKKRSLGSLILYLAINVVAIALILTGLSLIFWIARPYASLYLSSGQREALIQKVSSEDIKENRIIIPSVLVDAPIIEGFTKEALEIGVGHVKGSAVPGEDGNVILAGHNYAYFVSGEQNLFSLLHLIKEGSKIYVFYEGKRYVYFAKDKKTVPRDSAEVLMPTPYPQLTLVASASSWSSATVSSTKRLLIKAFPKKEK